MLVFMRALLIVFASFSGYFVLLNLSSRPDNTNLAIVGLVSGFLIAVAAIFFEERVKKTPLNIVLGGAVGLITGLIVANLITYPLANFIETGYIVSVAYLFSNCIVGYLGLTIGMKKGDDLKDFKIGSLKIWGSDNVEDKDEKVADDSETKATGKLLMDTSVIIDGRIADVCKTGFVDDLIMVPQFVLNELQNIADSPDAVRRARGKRGLDLLGMLQKDEEVNIEITEEDVPDVKAVDAKLVALAKEIDARVLTNDSNLNKVAELQGVRVLNINNLAAALKPVVLPGEMMKIQILKEGKEPGQGVGYLNDGTMIVVDNGAAQIGKTPNVIITSVLQTAGGRMIFAKIEVGRPPVYLHASN